MRNHSHFDEHDLSLVQITWFEPNQRQNSSPTYHWRWFYLWFGSNWVIWTNYTPWASKWETILILTNTIYLWFKSPNSNQTKNKIGPLRTIEGSSTFSLVQIGWFEPNIDREPRNEKPFWFWRKWSISGSNHPNSNQTKARTLHLCTIDCVSTFGLIQICIFEPNVHREPQNEKSFWFCRSRSMFGSNHLIRTKQKTEYFTYTQVMVVPCSVWFELMNLNQR